MSAVRSCTTVTHKFIQAQGIFTHGLSDIVGCLDSKENEEQNIMAEEDLRNNIVIDSGYSFASLNTKLVTDIERKNQLLHLYINMAKPVCSARGPLKDFGIF